MPKTQSRPGILSLIVTLISFASLLKSELIDHVPDTSDNTIDREYMRFILDYDLPIKERYQDVFTHFRPQLLDTTLYYWHNIFTDTQKQFFTDNIE